LPLPLLLAPPFLSVGRSGFPDGTGFLTRLGAGERSGERGSLMHSMLRAHGRATGSAHGQDKGRAHPRLLYPLSPRDAEAAGAHVSLRLARLLGQDRREHDKLRPGAPVTLTRSVTSETLCRITGRACMAWRMLAIKRRRRRQHSPNPRVRVRGPRGLEVLLRLLAVCRDTITVHVGAFFI